MKWKGQELWKHAVQTLYTRYIILQDEPEDAKGNFGKIDDAGVGSIRVVIDHWSMNDDDLNKSVQLRDVSVMVP